MTLTCWLCEKDFADSEGLAPASMFGPLCWDCHRHYGPWGTSESEDENKRQRLTYRQRQDHGFARRKDYEQDDADRYPWPVEEG